MIKPAERKNVLKVDMEYKNFFTFNDGTKIRLERKYDNFNMREVNPVQAIVIGSDYMPEGAECLIHHNSVHDTNRIFDYDKLSGALEPSDIRYYAVPETECFAWRIDGGDWQACYGFEIVDRLFKPYEGILDGIPATEIKNKFYVKTGKLKGNVVATLPHCDYEIVYQGISGREERLIRIRHFDNPTEEQLEKEYEQVLAIDHFLTEKVESGEYLIGINQSTAHKLREVEYA